MLKIRRPLGRLIFNMGIAIPGKTVFLIEMAPWSLIQYDDLILPVQEIPFVEKNGDIPALTSGYMHIITTHYIKEETRQCEIFYDMPQGVIHQEYKLYPDRYLHWGQSKIYCTHFLHQALDIYHCIICNYVWNTHK